MALPWKLPPANSKEERNLEICKIRMEQRLSLGALAKKFKLSKARIYDILNSYLPKYMQSFPVKVAETPRK